jgi:NAD(P)-dependent dehydrogenase (short-subunit alcohol dehydrogenase family)
MHYNTNKASIVAFTKALAFGLIDKGIRVDSVAPDPFGKVPSPSHPVPQPSRVDLPRGLG